MNKENKTLKEILKEFDKKSEKRCLDISLNGAELWCKEKTVKNFIKEKFETYFEKRLKKILPKEKSDYSTEKEIKRLNLKTKEQQWAMRAKSEGYNQCLSDILTKSK